MADNVSDKKRMTMDKDGNLVDVDTTQREATQIFKSRRFGRRSSDSQSGNSMWLTSFTDVMALMLTFFVLLFAMANPKVEDWENFTEELNKQFNKFYGMPLNRGTQDSINIQRVRFNQAHDLNYVKNLLEKQFEGNENLSQISMITQPPGREVFDQLIISLPENLLFEAGKAEMTEGGSRALYDLATFLDKVKNRIEIAGHADPRPISSGGIFASNWDLSLMRAVAVASTLENYGYARNLTVRGHASGRYDDLPDRLSTQAKLDLSRRVDIMIMSDSGQRKNIFQFQ